MTTPRPSSAIIRMARSSCSPESQRSDPSTSPVKHCEWMRTSGASPVRSPSTRAIAVWTRWTPFTTSRSKPNSSNTGPHLVGNRVETTCRTFLTWRIPILFLLASHSAGCSCRVRMRAPLCRRRALLRCGDDAAPDQAGDLTWIEAQFLEHFLIVLAEIGGSLCRHLVDAVDLNGTADGLGQLAARAFKRNDDAVLAQLRVLGDLGRIPHPTIGIGCR